MTWEEIFKLFISMLASVGGAGILILGFANWFGKIWAKKINDEYKTRLDKEIEHYRSELEKARNDYQRFASRKFLIIEETWSAINNIVDELENCKTNSNNPETYLHELLNSVRQYSKTISKNSLYFSDEIRTILNRYISICAEVYLVVEDELKKQDFKDLNKMLQKVYNKAIEREEILEEIRLKFKKELQIN